MTEEKVMRGANLAELMSKVAHELRSPLTSIQGFSSTLIKSWDRFSDEQKRQLVETIYSDSHRMARIVSEVLDLARAESGRLELNSSWLDLAAVLDNAIARVEHLPGSERVVVQVPEGGQVHGDFERLAHVFRNLIENAVKFSDEGDIVVSSNQTGDRVVVTVQDAGVGIEPERLGTIFEGPGPTGQKTGPSGTGLGLYLTKGLVAAHGGEIAADSVPGGGSTFTVVLPVPADD